MTLDDLSRQYSQLRTELERAYVAAVWDSGHIDRLTSQIADTESALATRGGPNTFFYTPGQGFGTSIASA